LRQREALIILERGEIAIVATQFIALVVVVILLSSFTPGQSSQSNPVIGSVYWGPSSQGTALPNGQLTKVSQNASVVTAYFTVAFSTQVSAVSGSRLCLGPNSTSGESTIYTNIPFSYDASKRSDSIALSPTVQQPGWVCTYTIKVTDGLSQTTRWLGSVELNP
jgi:hypothetical protein